MNNINKGIYNIWIDICIMLFLWFGLIIVPFLFWIMSNKNSQNNPKISSFDDSTDFEDVIPIEPNSQERNCTRSSRSLDTDAVNLKGRHQRVLSVKLVISDVERIEEKLNSNEKISLIFLLSDNPQDSLNEMKLSDWAYKEKLVNSHWEEKLWEGLSIIKNFQLPRKYGLSRQELEEEYFPFNYCFTKYILKFRKILFLICENFHATDENLFLIELKKHLKSLNVFPPKFSQMEMYFSYLLKIGYISSRNTRNCAKIAKTLDFEIAYDLFNRIGDKDGGYMYAKTMKEPDLKETTSQSTSTISDDNDDEKNYSVSLANSDSTQDNAPVNRKTTIMRAIPDLSYNMNGDKMCLIINQEYFYTEMEEQYQHLLPPNNHEEMLHTREGTEVDLNRLKSVFEGRKFEVTITNNLKHLKMIDEIEKFVKRIKENSCSCYFVIILSHGDNGAVYCANSCYVEISKIIEIMDHKRCIDIPKVLILQTCQGSYLQYDENLTTDGGASTIEPHDLKSPNFILFSSTVPGFATIRHKKTGTWFIQALCDQIEKYANSEHFEDICTLTVNVVSKRKWSKDHKLYYMVSYKKSTLGRKMYI